MFEIALEMLISAMVLQLPEMPASFKDCPPGKKQGIHNIRSLIYKKMERKLRSAINEATEELNELYQTQDGVS